MAQQQTSSVRDNDFSWNFVQFGLASQDMDRGLDIDSLYSRLSFALDEHFLLRGGLAFYDIDGSNRNYDGLGLSAGLGFHTPLKSGLDLLLSGDILHDRLRRGGNESGLRLAGGIRHRTTDQVELAGGAFAMRMYDNNEIGVYGEALVKVSEKFNVGAELQFGDDLTAIGVFGRIAF
jgi:hypothetical protein